VSLRDDLLLALDRDAVKRALQTCALGEADRLRFPSFVKSAAPKLFRA
jgi:hypothetical protein